MELLPGVEGVRAVVESLVGAWNRHDAAAFTACFAEDAEFTNVLADVARGRAEIERMHARPFATVLGGARMTVTDVRLRLIRPDVALADLRWESVGQVAPGGEPLPARNGLLDLVVVEDGGRWSIAAGHNVDYTAAYRRDADGGVPRV